MWRVPAPHASQSARPLADARMPRPSGTLPPRTRFRRVSPEPASVRERFTYANSGTVPRMCSRKIGAVA